jgi:transcription initiation factor TFIIA small subunit
MTLTDALDEMVTNGELTPSIAMKVLAQYDKCMNEALSAVKTKTTFKGNLDTYRFCDNVWTFVLDDVTFTVTGPGGYKDAAHVDKLKIVACDGKTGDQAGAPSKK